MSDEKSRAVVGHFVAEVLDAMRPQVQQAVEAALREALNNPQSGINTALSSRSADSLGRLTGIQTDLDALHQEMAALKEGIGSLNANVEQLRANVGENKGGWGGIFGPPAQPQPVAPAQPAVGSELVVKEVNRKYDYDEEGRKFYLDDEGYRRYVDEPGFVLSDGLTKPLLIFVALVFLGIVAFATRGLWLPGVKPDPQVVQTQPASPDAEMNVREAAEAKSPQQENRGERRSDNPDDGRFNEAWLRLLDEPSLRDSRICLTGSKCEFAARDETRDGELADAVVRVVWNKRLCSFQQSGADTTAFLDFSAPPSERARDERARALAVCLRSLRMTDAEDAASQLYSGSRVSSGPLRTLIIEAGRN